jgi:hypothetical protein
MTREKSGTRLRKSDPAPAAPPFPWTFDPKLLGEEIKIRALRLGHGFGAKNEKTGAVGWLARRSGVDKAMVSRIAGGLSPEPSVPTVARIAYALGATIDELVGLPPKPERAPLPDTKPDPQATKGR